MTHDNLRFMVQLYFFIKDGRYPSNETIQEKLMYQVELRIVT